MGTLNKNKFGVWMDSQTASIVKKTEEGNGEFELIVHVKNAGNAGEKISANKGTTLTNKYFKEIAAWMDNIDEVHITGPGQIQEHFMKFLAKLPRHKNAKTSESTSIKMSDEELSNYIKEYFK